MVREPKIKGCEPVVSVIMPVYNTARFLGDAIQSVIDQSFTSWELIIINDGSADNSLEIIEEFAGKDDRIIYISKANEGLPLTRRRGLQMARGEFIQHLDSDDALIEGALEALVARARSSGADVVNAPYIERFADGSSKPSVEMNYDAMPSREYLNMQLSKPYPGSVWSHFHRRSAVEAIDLQTPAHISMGEDVVMMTQILMGDLTVVRLGQPTVYYNINPDSLTNRSRRVNMVPLREFACWMVDYLKGCGHDFSVVIGLVHMRMTYNCYQCRDFRYLWGDVARMADYVAATPQLEGLLKPKLRIVVMQVLFLRKIAAKFWRTKK